MSRGLGYVERFILDELWDVAEPWVKRGKAVPLIDWLSSPGLANKALGGRNEDGFATDADKAVVRRALGTLKAKGLVISERRLWMLSAAEIARRLEAIRQGRRENREQLRANRATRALEHAA